MALDSLKALRHVLHLGRSPLQSSSTARHTGLCSSCLRSHITTLQTYRATATGSRALHTRQWPRTRHTSLGRRKPPCLAQRGLASVNAGSPSTGPIAEYNARVEAGKLREDDHQRTIVQSLQDLHETLADYKPPTVVMPSLGELEEPKKGLLSSIFHLKSSGSSAATYIPKDLPKGLYMFGDVGSGKTMLMDLFYDTLPPNITSKTRIHFHNFMQDVHKRLHKLRSHHGASVDVMPIVAAELASTASVLCFDEFQVTDIADAMILRRLVEMLMRHGCVIVTTSNRHPRDLYKNGIQRQSFIPCINLLLTHLTVLNLDSTTDYRKIPRPPSGVYHHPADDRAAASHAEKWFAFLGDPAHDPPHPATHSVWGREITVPKASGQCAWFTFDELIGRATGAADYLQLVREYDAFVVTRVPQMTLRERDWARRFITFVDAVYEGRGKLVLTTAVPLQQLFLSKEDMQAIVENNRSLARKAEKKSAATAAADDQDSNGADSRGDEHSDVDSSMRVLMDDLGLSMEVLRGSSIFSGDEEAFAFARALSRLAEMGSQEWVERGMGLEAKGGKLEKDSWQRVRSKWREDSM